MTAPVTGQKYDPVPIEGAGAEFVRGLAERARDPLPLDIGEPVDAIEAAAADNADDGPGQNYFAAVAIAARPRKCGITSSATIWNCSSITSLGVVSGDDRLMCCMPG